MYIDVSDSGVKLENPAEFTRFEVVSTLDRDRTNSALQSAGVGALREDDHVAVPQSYLRDAAGSAAEEPGWSDGFEKMLGYAQSKGWVTESGDVLAHVEWKS